MQNIFVERGCWWSWSGSRAVAGQSLAPAVVASHSTPAAVAYCLTTPAAAATAGAAASPYECLVPATFNVPWTIAVINPVILVTNISEQVRETPQLSSYDRHR